jgi:hypothetical protein
MCWFSKGLVLIPCLYVHVGGQSFVQAHAKILPDIVDSCVSQAADQQNEKPCNKDTGEKRTLRKMSRGHMFVVRAGGHIDMWTPLYQ